LFKINVILTLQKTIDIIPIAILNTQKYQSSYGCKVKLPFCQNCGAQYAKWQGNVTPVKNGIQS
jgi:hypothetical protein